MVADKGPNCPGSSVFLRVPGKPASRGERPRQVGLRTASQSGDLSPSPRGTQVPKGDAGLGKNDRV